ncbi:MAG: hypothetical protein G3H99_04465 [Ferrovum sp.]|nr:hypothetical protein [Ferrovum sp.]
MSNSEENHKEKHEQDKSTNFHIIINASAFEVPGPKITYRDLVNLAFPGDPGEIIYLTQYVAPHLPDGGLQDGESINLENGVKFDVTPTNRS